MDDILAIKALNQYRKRDIIAYLSLRYYFDNECSKTDLWANEVAVRLALNNSENNFLKTRHFKGMSGSEMKFREIYIPAPNDILAETALIQECSKYAAFQPNRSVYSYLFSYDSNSLYKQYVHGLKDRFLSINKACNNNRDGEVMYLDIQSFYTSIDLSSMNEIWLDACQSTEMPNQFVKLGSHFIAKYKIAQKNEDKCGLLVGPMFSHLLANLVFKEIDYQMDKFTENKYWRYVDDIIMVGSHFELTKYGAILNELLRKTGLKFHTDKKYYRITTNQWQNNRLGVDNNLTKKWIEFVGLLKKFMIQNKSDLELLKDKLKTHEIRLELNVFNSETKSLSLGKKLLNWMDLNPRNSTISENEVLNYANSLRNEYFKSFISTLESTYSNEVEYNSRISRLRYIVGRLIYLAKFDDLKIIADKISGIDELKLQFEIIMAIITLDISIIAKMGTNASQSLAQVIKSFATEVTFSGNLESTYIAQSLSVFKFHGIDVNYSEETQINDPLLYFAQGKINEALKYKDSYIDEVATLHGQGSSKHQSILSTLFDENESINFDVINNGSGSSYYYF